MACISGLLPALIMQAPLPPCCLPPLAPVVPQWSTEPYCSNAAALLALVEGAVSGVLLQLPGGVLGGVPFNLCVGLSRFL